MPATECLFVYGTLQRGCPNPWSRRLWSHAVFLGRARLLGRLYDLGPYPAFVEEGGGWVHGDLAGIADARILHELDSYEGAQYERVLRRVLLEDGAHRDAWVYVFRAPLAGARLIPDGRWPVK
ncbi:MAG: gamma-glutamylcyclotransferase [Bryobacteraceae bacterium]|nr:gamma-glutamylcyclotransferase [Bryobacteraceae bacterium]